MTMANRKKGLNSEIHSHLRIVHSRAEIVSAETKITKNLMFSLLLQEL